ncbi:hypothetical protein SLEP1_g38696 [Rubroshorea leprosula]|uniref:Amino acid transporter transmembrane domain-containing protein n=1 Tax=Rubroshorea leprosula TaxID=152421 RepID=A0AAV5KYL4_9ROSI|nr:hypothetical protein SLEP1_g38696 [Rubroshorea leprosula]
MEERPETELISIPATPRVSTPEIQTPSGQRSPRPMSKEAKSSTGWTPTSFISPRFLSPIGTPMKRVFVNMKSYLEEVGHLTKLNPQDAWLPITESRNGNAHYAAFHNLNAGVGFQALVLPVAFSFLGWRIIIKYNLSFTLQVSFFPGPAFTRNQRNLTKLYLGGLSLVGAVTAITYSTMVWVLSVSQQRPPSISYEPLSLPSSAANFFSVMNALGIIAFAFRGHNLVLEIQATMPSTFKHPAHVPMWRGAKVAYAFIAMCLFPIAIGGFWAYGNLMPSGGILNALYAFHRHDISRGLLALTFLLVVFNCLSSFQIYSMPAFDSFEAGYTSRTNRPCSIWVRSGFRVFYGFVSFFIGVALPFLSSLAGLLGGLTLPVTFAYPCFMWVLIKKPTKYSFNWYFHWILGWLGVAFSLAFSIGGIWSIVNNGLKLKFFKPN